MGVLVKSLPRKISLLAETLDRMDESAHLLSDCVAQAEAMKNDKVKCADYCADTLVKMMQRLREDVDSLEHLTDRSAWPMPTYYDLLFNV